MNFDIEALNIVLNTNIPDTKYKSIKFTRKLLYDPLDKEKSTIILNDYPYFTHDVKYPESNLLKLSYKDRVNFFFNLDRFNELLTPYISGKLDSSKKDDEYYNKRTENIDANINTMLLLLFPTKYPMINELSDSWDYVTSTSKNKKQTYGFLYNPFATQLYSYLDIGGKKYTTKSVVWLNDIMNHPTYNEFLREYRDFYVAATEQKDNAENEIEKKIIELRKYVKDAIALINAEVTENENLSGPSTIIVTFLNKLASYIDIDDDLFKKVDRIEKITTSNSVRYKEIMYLTKYSKDIKKYIKDVLSSWSTILRGSTGNNPTKLKIVPIKALINKILNTDLEQYVNKYEMIESFFTKTYLELNKLSNDDIIRKFYIILRRMRGVYLQSSNHNLQNLINLESKEYIDKFHKFMENVSKYMRNEKKDFKFFDEKDDNKDYLNIGLSFINLSVSDNRKTPRREINIMIDLIEGIVDDKNWSSINCSYLSEYLGNEFETIVRSLDINNLSTFNRLNTTDWRIDKNRMLFSIETKLFNANNGNANKLTNSDNFNKASDIQKDSGFSDNIFKFKNEYNATEPAIENIETLNSDFLSSIWEKGKEIDKKNPTDQTLENRIELLNKWDTKLTNGANDEIVSQQNLLKFLIKNKPQIKEILTLNGRRKLDVLIIVRKIQAENGAELSSLSDQLTDRDRKSMDNNKIYQMEYNIAKCLLYEKVLNLIANNLTTQRIFYDNERSNRGGNPTKKKLPLNKTHKITR